MKKSVRVLSLLAILTGIVGISGCDNKNQPTEQPTEQPSEQPSEVVTPSEQPSEVVSESQVESQSPSEVVSSEEVHVHQITEHPATEAFMAVNGHKAYYECEGCAKFFEDEEAENEIADLQSWLNGEGKIEEVENEKYDYANANPTYIDRSVATGHIWDGWPTEITMDEAVVSPKDSTRSVRIEVSPLKNEEGAWLDEAHNENKAVWITYEVDLPEGFDATEYKYLEFDAKLDNAQNWISARFCDADGNMSGEKLGDLYTSGVLKVTKISMDGWVHVTWNFADAYQFDTLLDEEAELSADETALYSIVTNPTKVRFAVSDSGADLTKPSVINMDNIVFSTEDDVAAGYAEIEEALQAEIIASHALAVTYNDDKMIMLNEPINLADTVNKGIKFAFKLTTENGNDAFRFTFMDLDNGWNHIGYFKIVIGEGDTYTINGVDAANYKIYADEVEGWMICELYYEAFNIEGTLVHFNCMYNNFANQYTSVDPYSIAVCERAD